MRRKKDVIGYAPREPLTEICAAEKPFNFLTLSHAHHIFRIALLFLCDALSTFRTSEAVSRLRRLRTLASKMEGTDMIAGNRIVAAAFGGALCLAASSGLSAADASLTMKPLMAASFDAGSKHVVSYFVGGESGCRLTMMVIDSALDEEPTPATQATRVVVPVADGKTAFFDSAVGTTLRFHCARGAEAMRVDKIDRVALRPSAE
ncbi:MAG: hypothetical protein AB7F41_08825 [Methylocystis sp.]|uniref:hypothetical protein n=1 Tax=Methylocystis sp. TaxID=1911079 RepID=UPI003D0ABD26